MLLSHRTMASAALLALALLCVFPSASGQSGGTVCEGLGIVTRKDIRDMSSAEWSNYAAAFNGLLSKSSGSTVGGIALNLMEALSQTHVTSARHNQPLFVVWHRLMLWQLDKDLNRVRAGVRQPYFDWSTSSSNLFGSSAFGSSRYGGSGTPIPNGAFAGIRSAVGSPGTRHSVGRSFDRGVQVQSRAFMNGLVATTLGFTSFRLALESAHNAFHNAVRGDMQVRFTSNVFLCNALASLLPFDSSSDNFCQLLLH
jgi:Common central domain of tyrosinase